MSRRLLYVSVAMCLACGFSPIALAQETATLPSAKELLTKHLDAIGGVDAVKKLKTMKVTGKMEIPQVGVSGEMETFLATGGKGLVYVNIAGIGEQKVGSNGDVIWEMSQITGAEILEGERAEQVRLQLSISSFSEYEKFFDTMECIGKTEFEGEECYEMKSQKGESEPVFDYFSVETGLQVGNKMKAATPMWKMEIATVVSDYKDVGDMKVAHKTVSKLPNGMTQEVTIKKLEVNIDIPEGKFDLPEEVAAKVKES